MNLELEPIRNIAEQVVSIYRKELEDKGINASSNLSKTASATVELNGKHLIVYLELDHYWKYVEYGRRAGKMPPVDKIKEWIRVKPIIPNPINGKIPDTKQLAFLIARKIGREGFEGKHLIENITNSSAINNVIDDITNEIMNQLKQQLIDGVKQ